MKMVELLPLEVNLFTVNNLYIVEIEEVSEYLR